MTPEADRRFMALALTLGQRGLGRVWPNPAVGCVIVQNRQIIGQIIGRGWTADGGRPHAETMALAQAGDLAKGATAYVTLEPCSHHGQTSPCADRLIDAGIARVVIACTDPDPRVSGRGITKLRDAGISVETGVLAAQAARDHAGFFLRVTERRPFVTLKLAMSLDGRIATATGDSQWITGPIARRAVHLMRAKHDAVIVGAGTVRADDPSLTVRGLGEMHQPVRVVLTTALDIPESGNLFNTLADAPLWLCHGHTASERAKPWVDKGAVPISCAVDKGKLDLRSALQELADRGITRVFCEGGGAIAASLIADGLVDRLAVFQAGVLIGSEGLPGLGPLGLAALSDGPRFSQVSNTAIGPDTLSLWDRV